MRKTFVVGSIKLGFGIRKLSAPLTLGAVIRFDVDVGFFRWSLLFTVAKKQKPKHPLLNRSDEYFSTFKVSGDIESYKFPKSRKDILGKRA